MTRLPGLVLACMLPAAAMAQSSAPIVVTPLAPLGPAQPEQPPAIALPPPSSPAPSVPPTPAPAASRPWLPQGTAMIQALDKVNAQSSVLTLKVGTSGQFGALTVSVQSCMVRPVDQPADATAFLTVTDSHAEGPVFSGWMLRSQPSLSMLEHAIYDLRVVGCGA